MSGFGSKSDSLLRAVRPWLAARADVYQHPRIIDLATTITVHPGARWLSRLSHHGVNATRCSPHVRRCEARRSANSPGGLLQVEERHPCQTASKGFTVWGRNRSTDRVLVRSGPSGDLCLRGSRITPVRVRARRAGQLPDRRVAAVAQNRGIQLRSVEAKLEARWNPGHPRHRQRRPQRLRRHQGHLQHRADASKRTSRPWSRVAEALGGLRPRDQPDERHRPVVEQRRPGATSSKRRHRPS